MRRKARKRKEKQRKAKKRKGKDNRSKANNSQEIKKEQKIKKKSNFISLAGNRTHDPSHLSHPWHSCHTDPLTAIHCNPLPHLQPPISNLQHPTSHLPSLISNLQHPISNLQSPTSNIQYPTSNHIHTYRLTGLQAYRLTGLTTLISMKNFSFTLYTLLFYETSC
jgi:hypothetical protein